MKPWVDFEKRALMMGEHDDFDKELPCMVSQKRLFKYHVCLNHHQHCLRVTLTNFFIIEILGRIESASEDRLLAKQQRTDNLFRFFHYQNGAATRCALCSPLKNLMKIRLMRRRAVCSMKIPQEMKNEK